MFAVFIFAPVGTFVFRFADGPPPAAPTWAETFLAVDTADFTALIIPTAWAAYPINNGMFCGNPTLAVFAVPWAILPTASAPFNVESVAVLVAKPNVDLAFWINSCTNIACLANNAALPNAVSWPNNSLNVCNESFFKLSIMII